jgi:L-asparaginase
MSAACKPKVAIIGTGGTIASLGRDAFDTIDYPEFGTKLELTQVLERVPEIQELADILPFPFKSVSSTALTIADALRIRELVLATLRERPDIAGVLILHGTGSLEETAFLLHLTIADPRPVILVGAQRPMNALGSDAALNLYNAVRVAAAPEARGRGVLVVLNDEIWSARDVVKSSNYRIQTFRSFDYGMLGQVDADRIVFRRRLDDRLPAGERFTTLDFLPPLPRVDILYCYMGADNVLIEASCAAGAKGLVIAGFAPGLITPDMRSAVTRYASPDFPIVIASRAAQGRVALRRWVSENGLAATEDLSPQKARIFLILALKQQLNIHEIRTSIAAV